MSDAIKLGHFVGAPAHALAYEGVSIAESTYASGTVVKPHAHDAALLTLVLSGDSTEENRGRSRNLVAQTLLFTPAFEMHGHLFRNAGRWLNMQFSDAWFARVAAGNAPLPNMPQLVQHHSCDERVEIGGCSRKLLRCRGSDVHCAGEKCSGEEMTRTHGFLSESPPLPFVITRHQLAHRYERQCRQPGSDGRRS
jgi:hypothetical protein